MSSFSGKVAIVTGGASGIGRALCIELARAGATIIVADINFEGAASTASDISSDRGHARAVLLDVTHGDDVRRVVRESVGAYGRLDYIFNVAGIGIAGEVRDMTPAHWQRIVDTNLWGVIHGTTAAYQVMVAQGCGHIVNIASAAGLLPCPMETAYACTKFAVVGLSTSLRHEAAPLGVNVSVVCPGFVQSGIYNALECIKADKDKLLRAIPFKLMDTQKAARVILRGVARNRAIIVFPPYIRLFWWLYRMHPSLLTYWQRKAARDFRNMRDKGE